MGATTWEPAGPARYQLSPGGRANTSPTELTAVPSPSKGAEDTVKTFSRENPLFVFGLIGAVTFGLMGFSTSARVGKTTASVSIGETK